MRANYNISQIAAGQNSPSSLAKGVLVACSVTVFGSHITHLNGDII